MKTPTKKNTVPTTDDIRQIIDHREICPSAVDVGGCIGPQCPLFQRQPVKAFEERDGRLQATVPIVCAHDRKIMGHWVNPPIRALAWIPVIEESGEKTTKTPRHQEQRGQA